MNSRKGQINPKQLIQIAVAITILLVLYLIYQVIRAQFGKGQGIEI